MGMIEIDWKPDARRLRQFAVVWFVGFGLIGLLVAWRKGAWDAPGWHGGWVAPLVLWAVAAVVGLVGYVLPRAVKPVYVVWMGIALPIGWLVTHLILAGIFYLVFTPIGLVFRLIGRDPLQRKFAPEAETYWIRRHPVDDMKRYLRQF